MRKGLRTILTAFLVCLLLVGAMFPAAVPARAEEASASQVYGWNLVLADEIAVNFWVDIADTVSADAVMNVTDGYATTAYPIAEAERNAAGQYLFTAHLAAAQLADTITLELVSDGQIVSTEQYKAVDYASTVLAGDYSTETKELVGAMLHYGAAAQTYFDYNTDNLANAGLTAGEVDMPQWTETAIVSGSVSGVRFYGASLVFDSRVAVRFYFKAESLINVSFGTYTPVEKNGMYYVEIPGINPQDYDKAVSLTVTDGSEEMTVSYSPMAYILRKYAASEDGALKNLTATMYQYHNAAKTYLAANGGVITDGNGIVIEQVIIRDGLSSAVVPAGTQLEENVTTLTLSATPMEETGSDVTVGENEQMVSLDVHIAGISAENTVPVIVTLDQLAPEFLNQGNIRMYHVEDGVTVEMIRVYSLDALDAHNEYYYDIATGTVTVAMASFSEIVTVANDENLWNGDIDTFWYTKDPSATKFEIFNADQLAGFGAIVGGMAEGIEQDGFTGKTVTLMADISIGDLDSENGIVFYPIGYNSDDGLYEKTGVAVSTGFYSFYGTFDGNGHTISDFYQNTWEMKGDNNYYDASLQYYRDGMGLFGRVYGATIKNLTVQNFSSDGEYTTTGTIAAYADCGAKFENITIFDCNPRVYNIGNGGIVGCVGWYAKDTVDTPVTFTNITVDNSNKISALWGSYDVACGGIVGQYYPTSGQSSANYPKNAGIHLENCHVAAQLDVYNDVCGNYQYYAYRYAGMMIGSIRENTTNEAGKTVPNMKGITATGCTVNYGDWNTYYYCELVANSLASYTHDHQFSRLTQVKSVDVENKTYIPLGETEPVDIPASGRHNFVVVKQTDADGKFIHGSGDEYAECYHFVDGKQHDHDDYNGDGKDDYEIVNGDEILVENNRHIYLPFHQLFTGYGWGVSSVGLEKYSGIVTNLDIIEDDQNESVEKFKKADSAKESYTTGTTVTVGELFAQIDGIDIKQENVQVYVSHVEENGTASGVYAATTSDWKQGTLTFSGLGKATVTITDYYFCTPTVINVTIIKKTPVVTAPTANDLTYTGAEQALVTEGSTDGGTLLYSLSVDGEYTENVPAATNAGQYTVYYKVKGNDVYDDVNAQSVVATIQQAPATGSATAATDLTYNKEGQKLVVSSEATNGKVVYSRTKDGEYTETIPTATDAGDHTFFYKVVGNDGNYADTPAKSVTVTIAKADSVVTVTPVSTNLTYSDEGNNLVEVYVDGGTVWYKVVAKTAVATRSLTLEGYSTKIPVVEAAGTYIIYYKVVGDKNHNDIAEQNVEVTIAKADPKVTAPTKNVLTYTGAEQALVTAGSTNGGTLLYSLSKDAEYTETIPTATNAGQYTVYYKVVGGANYNDTAEQSVVVNIARANPVYVAPTGLTATYGDLLSSVKLPAGFAWENGAQTVGNAGTNTFAATFTHDDTANYNIVEGIQISIEINAVQKFEIALPNDEDYLYRVGNANNINLGWLFKGLNNINTSKVKVTVTGSNLTNADYTFSRNSTTWDSGILKFNNGYTGVVKVTITDDEYCIPTELYLEVVDAVNATSATNAIANNVVLLRDIGFSSVEVSGGYTLYGNGFTMTCGSDSVASNMSYAFVTVTDGTLDNVQIICPNFSLSALYAKNYQVDGNSVTDSSGKTRYYNVKSGVKLDGNSRIINSYISGGRAAVYATSGSPVIENSTIRGGAAANIQADGVTELVLRDVTLIQEPIKSTDGKATVMGFSVVSFVDSEGYATPIRLEGTLNQYAWACKDYAQYVPEDGQSVIAEVMKKTDFLHDITYPDGVTRSSVNLGIAGLMVDNHGADNANVTDNRIDKTLIPYNSCNINTAAVIYSYTNAQGTQSATTRPSYEPTQQGSVLPQVVYTPTTDAIAVNTAHQAGSGWHTKITVDLDNVADNVYTLNFSDILVQKYGHNLSYSLKGENGSSVSGSLELTDSCSNSYVLTITDDLFYNADGTRNTARQATHTLYLDIIASKTSIAAPEKLSDPSGTALKVTSSKDWNIAVPVLEGVKIKYWSTTSKRYVELSLKDLTPTTKGRQNGENNNWEYNGEDYTLTITSSKFHDGNSVYGAPTVYNSILYFTAANSSKGMVGSSTTSRSVTIYYTFKDNNGGELNFSKTWTANQNDLSGVSYNTVTGDTCITPDTLITLADGTQVRVDSLTGNEELLVWNMITGQLDSAPILFIDSDPETEYEVVHLYFSDGTDVKVIYEHGFWDYDLNRYVYLDANAAQYIGHTFAKQNGDILEAVTLTDVVLETVYTSAWSPVTAEHLCYFVNGMLSMPGGVGGLFNIFEVNPETMTYDPVQMQQDMEIYGLFTYEELASYAPALTEKMFDECGGAYLKISIGKGNMTMDELVAMINRYSKFF